MSTDLVTIACAALAEVKHKLVTAEAHVPNAAGRYAIYGASDTWRELGLGDPTDARPLYVGKAEVSLQARDLEQHFRSGSTGSPTIRRTFAALLRDAFSFRGVPRNQARPDKPSHFALADDQDAKLTAWMKDRLELAVWPKPIELGDLHAVEVGVIACFVPPLNIQDNASSPWLEHVRMARAKMADDARTWASARGGKI